MMKRLHPCWLALVAVFVASGAFSAAANAELAILPTPTEANPINFTFTGIGKGTVETVSGKKITCSSLTGTGQITSPRLDKSEMTFTGCENTATKAKCTGLANAKSGEITLSGEGHIRHLLPASEGVALAILLGHLHYTCSGILFLGLGCIASMAGLTKAGGESVVEKLISSLYGSFLQEKGQQKPLEIDNDTSTGMEACMSTVQEETRTPEEVGLLAEGTLEKFEQGGKSITGLLHLK